jgi:hypothetical protein
VLSLDTVALNQADRGELLGIIEQLVARDAHLQGRGRALYDAFVKQRADVGEAEAAVACAKTDLTTEWRRAKYAEAELAQAHVALEQALMENNALKLQLTSLSAQLKHKFVQVVVPTDIALSELQFAAAGKEEIGRGAAAVVYAATLRGESVAVKEMHGNSDRVRAAAANELAIAKQLMGHPNIVATFGVVQQADRLSLVMERLPLTLADALHGAPNKAAALSLCTVQRLAIAHSVASGLRFCHAHNPPVVHRDLKPGNVLLSQDLRTVKLCDFGSARALADAASLTIGVGTVQYTAPEVLDPPTCALSVQYGAKVDVYSFGILLWELFAGNKPYTDLSAAQVPMAVCARNVRPSPDPLTLPEALVAMMKRCWQADVAQRPTMAAVVAAVGQVLTNADAAAQQTAADRNECVVCADEQRSTALVPCGHVCCCADCAADLHECPICRQAIRERVKLFHS